MSEPVGGASTEGAGALVGKAAVFAAGLPLADGALGKGLEEVDERLAFEGAFLIEDAGDLVGLVSSVAGVESALDC